MGEKGKSEFHLYTHALLQFLPEIFSYTFCAGISVFVPAMFLNRAIITISGLSSRNADLGKLKDFVEDSSFPALFFLFVVLSAFWFFVGIIAKIHTCNDLLRGRTTGFVKEIVKSAWTFVRFLNPLGIAVIVFSFFVLPLPICAVGLAMSLSEHMQFRTYWENLFSDYLYIPVLLVLLAGCMIFLALRYLFLLQGVIVSKMKVKEAAANSVRLWKENKGLIIRSVLGISIFVTVVMLVVILLFYLIPDIWLDKMETTMPFGYVVSEDRLLAPWEFTQTDRMVVAYRVLSAVSVIFGNFCIVVSSMICGCIFMLGITALYKKIMKEEYTFSVQATEKKWFALHLYGSVFICLLVLVLSVFGGYYYNQIFQEDQALIVAHRAGGVHASENSLAGIEYAISKGCYASEIDVQRTKDGIYIINHDASFFRVAGREGNISEIEWKDIMYWLIPDTTGNGEYHRIPTLNDMVEATVDRENLFIELKGKTADEQMVDELVKYIRAKRCEDQVAFISFNRDTIEYAEENYPEFETGLLVSGTMKSCEQANCDMVLLSHLLATYPNIRKVKSAGKEIGVWTVNNELEMKYFLRAGVNYIITDQIDLVEDVRRKYDERTDREHMIDAIRFGFEIREEDR